MVDAIFLCTVCPLPPWNGAVLATVDTHRLGTETSPVQFCMWDSLVMQMCEICHISVSDLSAANSLAYQTTQTDHCVVLGLLLLLYSRRIAIVLISPGKIAKRIILVSFCWNVKYGCKPQAVYMKGDRGTTLLWQWRHRSHSILPRRWPVCVCTCTMTLPLASRPAFPGSQFPA